MTKPVTCEDVGAGWPRRGAVLHEVDDSDRRARAGAKAQAAKPNRSDGDSTGEGLSPRRHTPISAPRSETRSRPQGRAARLLLSSADFVSFRAPIDSVMDPGGQPRRPMDPFLSLHCGFGPLRGWETRRLTLDRCFNRSATPH